MIYLYLLYHIYCIISISMIYCHFKKYTYSNQFSSVAQLFPTLRYPHELQHARPPCPSPTPGVHPNPCPLSQWCHPIISSSVVPISSCLLFFPASGYFLISQLFASGGHSFGRTDAEAETPILWPPYVKNWLIWKDPDAGTDWRQKEKRVAEDEIVR